MGTSIAIKSAAEVDEETGEWKQKTLSVEEKEAMIKRAPGLAKLTAGKSDAEVDAIIAKVRDQMGRKSPRYRCHLGCILLRMAAISLPTEGFKSGGLSAADAAGLIIRGTLEKRWRILIGDDAHRLDQAIRAAPESAYDENPQTLFGSEEVEGWAAEGSLRVEAVGEAVASEAEAEAPEPAAEPARARL